MVENHKYKSTKEDNEASSPPFRPAHHDRRQYDQ